MCECMLPVCVVFTNIYFRYIADARTQNITINMNTSKYVDGCECECACGGVDHSASQMNVLHT